MEDVIIMAIQDALEKAGCTEVQAVSGTVWYRDPYGDAWSISPAKCIEEEC